MEAKQHSYRQIMKSTGIFGGSQVITLLIGIVRTKVVALLLGPNGVGLMSVYQSIVDMIRSVSDLGLSFSSVKDMSQAQASNDEERIAGTSLVLRRWIRFTALLGCLLTILFSRQISWMVFSSDEQVYPVCLLSFCIFMTTLSAGQRALLQGMRHIGDMAKASVLGTLAGFVISTLLFYFLGEEGIIPSLLLTALAMWLCSWGYARRLPIRKVCLSIKETVVRGKSMLVLGLYSVAVGVASTVSMLIIKSCLMQWSGEETVGLFQSSWSMTAMSLSAIFSAMAADYYPRLCAIAHDNEKITQYVNEQLRVALLLSTAVVVAMLLFSPLILQLFYSSKFVSAEGLLRWQMLGSFLKVANWPFAYIILSKGNGKLFMLTEWLWHGLFLSLTLLLWKGVGLEAAGIAYLMAHVIYTVVIVWIVRKQCGFRMEKNNISLLLVLTAFVLAAFFLAYRCPIFNAQKYVLSLAILLTVTAISLKELNKIYPLRTLFEKIKKRFVR